MTERSVAQSSLPEAPERRALICGATGQDGAYLARLLVDKGYRVTCTSRDASNQARWSSVEALGLATSISRVAMNLLDGRSVEEVIARYAPNEIYNLAAQSSVGLSFERPRETVDGIVAGTLNLLEAIRHIGQPMRFFNAGSGECFGETAVSPADESTPMCPTSPYAVAKTFAHHLVATYRQAYGLHVCTGILFNHESPLRPERYVTQKIVHAARRISSGDKEPLLLGNMTIMRDWGWAPDYVEAMWRMLQNDDAADVVIATGQCVSLEYFVSLAFAHFGLDWKDHVHSDQALHRPTDPARIAADPTFASRCLGWRATNHVEHVVAKMCELPPAAGARSLAAEPSAA